MNVLAYTCLYAIGFSLGELFNPALYHRIPILLEILKGNNIYSNNYIS